MSVEKTAILKEAIDKKVYLTEYAAKALCDEVNMLWDDFLFALIEVIRWRAVKPLSNYHVGAIAIASSGNLYFGTSLDFVSTATIHNLHAEQSAVSNAYTHGENKIDTIVVNAAPCGFCRQFLTELGKDAEELTLIFPPNIKTTLKELLPHPFGPWDLGHDGGMLTSPVQDLQLAKADNDPVIAAALKAACRSYSATWHSYSGVAIQAKDGKIFSGSFFENVTENPVLSPLMAALLQLTLSQYKYADIERVVLVESSDNQIKQGSIAQDLLNVIADNIDLEIYIAAL